MNLDPQTLGRRLKEARENRRMTQEAAATAIGIQRTALVQVETGKRALSTLEFSKLVKLYGRSAADFLHDGSPQGSPEEDTLVILTRVSPGLFNDKELEPQVRRYLDLCEIGVALERDLGYSNQALTPAVDLPFPSKPFEATRQGERAADDERRRLGLGYGPIADMADLLASRGIWVSGVKGLPGEVSGIFVRNARVGLVILVRYGEPRTRKRFSYAHEYGHALLDRAAAIVTARSNSLDLIERRANAFAASFLMPREGVRAFLENIHKGGGSRQFRGSYSAFDEVAPAEDRPAPGSQKITFQDAMELAHYYGVSYQTAVYRLMNLDWITFAEKDDLLNKASLASKYAKVAGLREEDSPRGDPSTEPQEPNGDRELVNQVTYLAIEAYRRELVSVGWLGDLAGQFGMDPDDLIELAEGAGSSGD